MVPDALNTSTRPAGSRLRVRVYGVVAALLALFLLTATPASAAVAVQLSPSPAAPQPVGTTVTWTASAADPNPGTLEYQFSIRPPGGDFAVVRDFSPSNSFQWMPSEREGAYDIRVNARNATTKEAAQLVVSYSVSSRVSGDSPVVSATSNPLVALYSAPACDAGSMRVRFWRAGDFSSSVTSWKPCRPGVSMNFYVAGMLADTQYSMRHEVSSDPEAPVTTGPALSFLTGAPPGVPFPSISVLTPSPGGTGQDVILNSSLGYPAFPVPLNATDLSGRLLWYYPRQTFLILRPVEGGTIYVLPYGQWQDILREIDLAGNTVRETNIQAVSDQLLARGGQAITSFHHDAGRLPDGNTVVLASVERTLSDVQGPGPVTILGDMILVLDKNWQVAWSWNSFDHLDVTRKAVLNERCTRQPGCATTAASANDWLHSNSVTYSPADGNLLLSMRDQDWVVKIDYRDGSGTGDVLWRLGKDGDFTTDSTDPYPWFSHQHDVEYEADGTLTIYDNGNTRQQFPNATANSRGQVLKIDEPGRKVTFILNADLGAFSAALGSAQKLKDGGYHFLSGFLNVGARSTEVGPGGALGFTLQAGISTYRTFRMRDLYTLGTPLSADAGVDQTIDFEAVTDHVYGDAAFTLSAAASSGLPVAFRVVSGPATLSGNVVTVNGVGTVVLQADQYGNTKYNEALSVRRSFAVAKANQSIAFGALSNKTFGDAPFNVSATGGASGNPVTFSAAGVCTSGGPDGGTITVTGAGSCAVTASQAGDSNYNAAVVTRSFEIARASQTITFAALTDKSFGNAPFALSANASSGLPVSFGVVSGPASISGNTLTITGTGTVTVRAAQAGNINYTPAPNADRSFNVAKANQTITFGPLPNRTYGDSDFTLSATAGSGLSVSFAASGNCTVSGATVHLTGAGSCTVTASQAGDLNYGAAANVAQSFQIAKANPTTTVTAGDAVFDGGPHGGAASVTGFGGLNQGLTVSYSGRNSTTYGPSGTAPTNAGDYVASASYAGASNYNTSSGSKDFSITKAGQTVNFGPPSDKTFGDAPFAVSATGGGSGNPITFDSQTPATCSVSDAVVTIMGAGTCTVRASQAGNNNYGAAANVARSFQVAQAATATAVTSSDNPAGVGQGVAYTATVTSASGVVTGVVRFLADGVLYGPTGVPCVAGVGNICTAELRAGSLPAGNHTIRAEYLGTTNFLASAGTLAGGQAVVEGGVFQFAQPVYSVGERGGSVTVRVLRNGDTSLPVSVDYTTDDGSTPSVLVPCSARTGAALDRCDYGRALGTLRFAAGLREQTFTVLVNDDSFVEGAETATLRLSNPAGGAALASVSTATLEITDDAPESEGSPIDDDEAFVAQHYRDFLNRAPDPEGLKFWTDGLKACGTDQRCREVKRVDISAAFFLSIEFQETGYLVERVYKTAYGDATSPNVPGTVPVVRLNEFLAEAQRVGRGVIVNSPGWEQRLADNKQAYALEFVQRPGFTNIFLPTLTAEEFVTKLDQNAGGVLSDAEKTQLISTLGPAPGDASKRAAVLRQVAESAVLRQRETDRAFVLMQFYGYLRRNPDDAPEKDLNFAGWKFWLDKLESFGGDYRRAEMVKAFISSDEYRQRFGQ